MRDKLLQVMYGLGIGGGLGFWGLCSGRASYEFYEYLEKSNILGKLAQGFNAPDRG